MAEGGYDPKSRNLDSRSRPVCRFYLLNNCTKGDKCAFRHANDATEKDMVCQYYQLGSCAYGKHCKFTHVRTQKRRDISAPVGGRKEVVYASKPSVTEFPSRMVTLRKGGSDKGVQESESARSKKEYDQNWVWAQDFVPGKKFHGSIPSSYANAVQPNQASVVTDTAPDLLSMIRQGLLLCPFFEHSGKCPFEGTCEYAHAFICDFCGLPKLHPTDEEQREKHVKECIEEHEKQMEHAFAVQASQDKECGICLDNVMNKDKNNKRFGILENCNHCFCLSCIRTWRHNKSNVIQTQRTCPTCRTHSDFVTPSKFWVESPRAKRKLIEDYKKALSSKTCQYFKKGKGECPFDSRCFYQHALEDGTIVHENVIRRRRRVNADGVRAVDDDYSLWDYITRREEDGELMPLDAQLSLLLLGIFHHSDDDDDDDDDNNNNSNFALRYNFLNGDFVFTDSELDTDSD